MRVWQQSLFQFPNESHSFNLSTEGGEGVIEKYVDGGMFLSEIEGGRVYGMYGGIWGNGKKKGSEQGSRWAEGVRRGLITATGCGSCAIENVKYHPGQSSIFLHVCWRFPKSIPQLTQTRIPGTEVVNLAGLAVQLKVYEPRFLVGHGGEGPGEPRREAKVSPRGTRLS